jgi:hypothetical protein
MDEHKFVSEAMQRRIDSGVLTSADLNKLFPITRRDEESLSSGLESRLRGKDRVAVAIGLESCIIDASSVFLIIEYYST